MLLVACAPSPLEVASQTAEANTSIAMNWTKTLSPTLTPTATNIPTSTATATPIPPKITILDAFFYDTATKSAASKFVLEPNKKYWVILSGTYSHWVAQPWLGYNLCWGTSEPQPMFLSPRNGNGPVGSDPYQAFGEPGGVGYSKDECESRGSTLTSMPSTAIRLSLDGGISFAQPIPAIQEIRADHTYAYAVIGQGHPLAIRIDDYPLEDNHGQIFVVIQQIN